MVNGNEVTFTRGAEFPGTATFTYRVTSTNGSSAPQIVTLTGLAAPLVITQAPARVTRYARVDCLPPTISGDESVAGLFHLKHRHTVGSMR